MNPYKRFFAKIFSKISHPVVLMILTIISIATTLYLFHPDVLLTYWQQGDFTQLIKISDFSTFIFYILFHFFKFFQPSLTADLLFNQIFYLYLIYFLILIKSIAIIHASYYFLKIPYDYLNKQYKAHTPHKRPKTWRKILSVFLFYSLIFSICFHWLHIATHEHGKLFWPMSIFALFVFGAYNALYYTFAAFLTLKLRTSLLGFAFLTAAFEYLKAKIFTGFPWALGIQSTIGLPAFVPLHKLLPYLGEYALNLIFWLLIIAIPLSFKQIKYLPLQSWLKSFKNQMILLSSMVLVFQIYQIKFNQSSVLTSSSATTKNLQSDAQNLRLRLVQGNIDQKKKFDLTFAAQTQKVYQDLIVSQSHLKNNTAKKLDSNSNSNLDLIVTPETALPILLQDVDSNWFKNIVNQPHLKNTEIVMGALDLERDLVTLTDWKFVNRLFNLNQTQFNQNAQIAEIPPHLLLKKVYAKHHLVPFGEFVPWGFQWYVDLMKLPLGQLYRAPRLQMPFALEKNINAQFNICYEIIFSDEVAWQNREMPADILINNTNLAWFGHTSVFWQFLKMAQMRAYELQIPVAIAANNGPSVVIAGNGQIQRLLPTNVPDVLDIDLEIQSKNKANLSFYVKNQALIEKILEFLIFLFLLISIKNMFRSASTTHNRSL